MSELNMSNLNLEQVFEIKDKVDYFFDQAEKLFESSSNPNEDFEYKKMLDTAVAWLHKLYDSIGGSKNISEFNKISEIYRK